MKRTHGQAIVMLDKEHIIEPLLESQNSYGAITQCTTSTDHQHYLAAPCADTNGTRSESHQQQQDQQENQHPQNPLNDPHNSRTPSRVSGLVPMEIPVFLYYLALNTSIPLMQYYLTDRMYEELSTPNVTSGGSPESEVRLSEQVQDLVATYTMIIVALTYFPAVLPALLMGFWSDRFGRKAVLYVSILGVTVRIAIFTLLVHFRWPVEALYAGVVVEGLTGSFASFQMATCAIVADITRERSSHRGFRYTVVESALMTGSSAGSTIAGYWVERSGYMPPLLASIGLQVLVLLFIALFIPETLPKTGETKPVTWSMLLGSVRVIVRRGRRCFLLTCLLVSFLATLTLVGNAITILLYLLSPPFSWTKTHISIYSGLSTLASWLAMLTVTACLKSRLEDDVLALTASLSTILGFLLQGLARSDLWIYLAAIAALLSHLVSPMMKSLMSSATDAEEQGCLFAGIGVMQLLSTIVGGFIGPALYKMSLGQLTGLPFLCFAAVHVVSALCIISLIVSRHVTR